MGFRVAAILISAQLLMQVLLGLADESEAVVLNKCSNFSDLNFGENTTSGIPGGYTLKESDLELDLELEIDLDPDCNANSTVTSFEVDTEGLKNASDQKTFKNRGPRVKRNNFTVEGFAKIGDLYVNPRSYCLSSLTNTSGTVKTCLPHLDKNSKIFKDLKKLRLKNHYTTIIPKCCPLGSIVSMDVRHSAESKAIKCVEMPGKSWRPFLYKRLKGTEGETSVRFEPFGEHLPLSYKLIHGNCNITKVQTPLEVAYAKERALIRVTELKTYTRSDGNHDWMDVSKDKRGKRFCIDGLQETTSASYTRSPENQIVILCGRPESPKDHTPSIVHISLNIVACTFLFLIIVVHALVWNTQNIHGWTVATYSSTVFVFLFLKTVENFYRLFERPNGGAVGLMGHWPCFVVGVILHFAHIAMFSWMAVLNFDLLSAIVSMTSASNQSDGKSRFKCYLAVGFGVPSIIVSISLFVDLYFGYYDDTVIRPMYGNHKCYLHKTAELYYSIIVNVVLFGIGIILSCFTLRFLIIYAFNAKRLQQATKHSRRRQNMTKLLSKAFVLLAFSYIFEILGIYWTLQSHKNRWHVLLYCAQNLIHSIGFFWIFVCKDDVKNQLRFKYRIFEDFFYWVDTTFDVKPTVPEISSYSNTNNPRGSVAV